MRKKLLDPIPPGEILFEEFMKPLGISINGLARDIDVPPNRISEIVSGKRTITADTALHSGSTSVSRPRSGLTCSRTTTSAYCSVPPGPRSSRRFASALPDSARWASK